jgi:CHASE3 domain sensor protein
MPDRIDLSLNIEQALAVLNAVEDAMRKIDERRGTAANAYADNPDLRDLLDRSMARNYTMLEEVRWMIRYALDPTEEDKDAGK